MLGYYAILANQNWSRSTTNKCNTRWFMLNVYEINIEIPDEPKYDNSVDVSLQVLLTYESPQATH